MGGSRIRPSKAPIWVNCPGYVALREHVPDEPSGEAADEGNDLHSVSALVLRGVAQPADFIGSKGPKGTLITPEGARFIGTYTQAVLSTFHHTALNVEDFIKVPAVHPESEGTTDCWAYNSKAKELYIWDAKFGWKIIEAYENWQFINYYAGILEKLRISDMGVTVRFIVVQPKAPHPEGPIRTWRVKAEALRPYVNRLHMAAHEALGPNPKARSGPWCGNCEACYICPASNAAAYNGVDVAYAATPFNQDPAAIGKELHVIKAAYDRLANRKEALESQASTLLKMGKVVPGWCLEPVIGNMEWTKPEEEIRQLGALFGVEATKVKTPAQLRDAGVPMEVIQTFSARNKRGVKLAIDNKAAKIFGGN